MVCRFECSQYNMGGFTYRCKWEDLMDERDLDCMNKGSGTRINITTGTESALDITLVSYFFG